MAEKEKRKIVLAPPYDGGYIWLLNKNMMRHDQGGHYGGSNSYYQTLYGKEHPQMASRAASLSILYDEVFITPADMGLPDIKSFMKGTEYFNPLIGLHHNWSEYHKERDILKHLAEEDLRDPDIAALLPEGKSYTRQFILERINYQAMLAIRHNAKLLAGPMVRSILDIKMRKIQRASDEKSILFEEPSKIKILDKYFEFACFHFESPRYEDLVALKQDRDVQDYARRFHNTMDLASNEPNPYVSFIRLMNTTKKHAKFAGRVRGGLAGTGRLCTYIGLIPIAGTASGIVGAVADAGDKGVEIAEKNYSWYLLGPKMSEVLLEERMSRKIDREEKNIG